MTIPTDNATPWICMRDKEREREGEREIEREREV